MSEFYTKYADLYRAVADDRDFEAEVRAMLGPAPRVGSAFVELFAGPAYHCAATRTIAPDLTSIAIDTSSEMQRLAAASGAAHHYFVGDVSDVLRCLPKSAHVVCVPRYSIVLISEYSVGVLFAAARRVLAPGGVFFLEVHPDSATGSHVPITGEWEDLDIHVRRRDVDGMHVTCEWPESVKLVQSEPRVLDMTVRVLVDKPDAPDPEVLRFTSREHIHTAETLWRLAAASGLREAQGRSFSTADGHFFAFEALEELGAVNTRPDLVHIGWSWQDAALARLADSGLDTDKHDAVLRKHVYNLL